MTAPVKLRRVTPTGGLVLPATASREEWLAARRTAIGSSDAPQVLGMHGSALGVWYDKRGIVIDQPQTDAMLFGHLFEEPIAREWARRNHGAVRKVGLVANVDEPFLACTLDRRVVACPLDRDLRQGCGLEVKCRNVFGASTWSNSGIPDDVLAQVLHQLHVTGYDHMHVAALIGGNDYRQRVVWRDREADVLAYVLREERKFWREHVVTGVKPQAAGNPGDLLDLHNRLHPDRAGVLDLDVESYLDAVELLNDYSAAHAEAKAAKVRKDTAKAALIGMLGDAEEARGDGRPLFTYLAQGGPPKVDLDRLAEHHPEAYAACVTPGTQRVFNAGLRRLKGTPDGQ